MILLLPSAIAVKSYSSPDVLNGLNTLLTVCPQLLRLSAGRQKCPILLNRDCSESLSRTVGQEGIWGNVPSARDLLHDTVPITAILNCAAKHVLGGQTSC